jgi:hypothetical protein
MFCLYQACFIDFSCGENQRSALIRVQGSAFIFKIILLRGILIGAIRCSGFGVPVKRNSAKRNILAFNKMFRVKDLLNTEYRTQLPR